MSKHSDEYTTYANDAVRTAALAFAREMIARSVRQNEIAHADYTDALAAELLAECDGSARGEGVVEYWGETDKGYAWRCHIEMS